MIFYCPRCAGCTEITEFSPNKRVQCPYESCQEVFACSEIRPYCYACDSPEVVTWIATPLGWVYGCKEHAANVKEFWLLSWIQFSVVSAQHAREWAGGPMPTHGGGGKAFRKAVGL